MQYTNKPDKINKVKPSVIVNPFSSQSYYINNGKAINEKGYWTKTSFDEDSSYAIDYNGNNEIISKLSIYGIRPVINIEKKLLKIDSGVINITNIIMMDINMKFFKDLLFLMINYFSWLQIIITQKKECYIHIY